MVRIIKKYFSLIIVFSLIFSSHAIAQNALSATAEVDSNVLTLGSAGHLMITISGAQDVSPIEIPAIQGLDIKYQTTSSQMSFVNFKKSSSVTFVYSVFPNSVGKFLIPALNIQVDNQVLKTEPISIEVVDQGGQPPLQADSSSVTSLKDRIFLKLQIPKTELYLNEKVPVKAFLFINGLNVSDPQYPQLEAVGFTLSDWGRSQQFQQVINGVRYDILEIDAYIYPTRTGEIKLGPAKMALNLIVQTSNQNRSGNIMDDDFFNVVFNRQEAHPIQLQSNEVTLQVKDLPQEGKPQDFSGAVGNFTFDVSVSPTDVKVGDPITLKMSVQGEGNLSAINFPKIRDENNFKDYDPSIKEDKGVKKFEQVIIPKRKDVKEVPAFSFSYFNTELHKYTTVTKGPFPINILESESAPSSGIVSFNNENQPEKSVIKDTIGEDIVFIKESPGRIYSKGEYFYAQLWFYLCLIILVFAYVGFLFYYHATHRLMKDQNYARRFHAPKYAKAGLELARRCLAEKRIKEFYDAIFKTLQNYLTHKFLISLGDVNFERVKVFLTNQNQEKMLSDLKFIFDECDRIRYSSVTSTEFEMQNVLNKLETIIDALERLKT